MGSELATQFGVQPKALSTASGTLEPLWGRLALSIGVGIYEELVFRLVFISMAMIIGADLLRINDIRQLGAPSASIGGAGTFDGIFLTGIVAVLLA